MTHPPQPSQPTGAALHAERERIVQRLSEAFAADDLDLDDLEARLSLVWRADSLEALRQLVADLPPPPQVPTAPGAEKNTVVVPGAIPARQTLVGVGGLARRGAWRLPRDLRVVAIFGVSRIDLREAELTSPIHEITAIAIAGRVEIVVPPGVLLESDGDVFHGRDDRRYPPGGSAPVIRVHGFTLLGGVIARVG